MLSGVVERGPEDDVDGFLAHAGYVSEVPDTGALLVSDREDPKLLFLDASLEPAGSIGSEGRGPGELLQPRTLHVSEEWGITVVDPAQGRVSRFDVAGDYERSFPVESGNPVAVLADGSIVAPSLDPEYLLSVFRDDAVIPIGERSSLPGTLSEYNGSEMRRPLSILLSTWDSSDNRFLLVDTDAVRAWDVTLRDEALEFNPVSLPEVLVTNATDTRTRILEAMTGGQGWAPAIRSARVQTDGSLWIMPLSRDIIGAKIEPSSGTAELVWASPSNEAQGLIDGFYSGDQVHLLYRTEVRRYGVAQVERPPPR